MAIIEAMSSDDEDAPESFSLQDSKRIVKRQTANLLHFEASERDRKKARNRERDKRLKEQAKFPKRRLRDAKAMHQAMRDAEEEGEDISDAASGDEYREGQSDSSDGDADANDIRRDENEHLVSDHIQEEDETPSNPNFLPDHFFVSAFSKRTTIISGSSAQTQQTKSPKKRSKKHSRSAKDVVVGSRTLRMLEHSIQLFPSAAATVPRGKVKAFIDRSLGLRRGTSKSKSWTRKPAHLGSMKAGGPPTTFVRRS